MNENKLSELEKKIKVTFKNKTLLKNAFVHRSYLNENHAFDLPSNERLEFLGDAVLEFCVSQYLFTHFSEKREGDLTSYRSALVCTESLSQISLELQFGNYLFLSRGEEATGGRERPYILANTFEALLGAIFLDQGIKKADAFVLRFLIPHLDEILDKGSYRDAKSQLQEVTQEKVGITPHYEVIEESGPDHDKNFIMGVYLDSNKIGEGKGKSKQKAEQSAAADAISNWGNASQSD